MIICFLHQFRCVHSRDDRLYHETMRNPISFTAISLQTRSNCAVNDYLFNVKHLLRSFNLDKPFKWYKQLVSGVWSNLIFWRITSFVYWPNITPALAINSKFQCPAYFLSLSPVTPLLYLQLLSPAIWRTISASHSFACLHLDKIAKTPIETANSADICLFDGSHVLHDW